MPMRLILILVALCAGQATGLMPASAADDFKAGGHWTAEKGKFIFFHRETVSVPDELEIDVVIDDSHHPALFVTMTETYVPGASAGYHVNERIVEKKTFDVVGAVSYADGRIVLGDVDDTTVWSCDIEAADRMTCLAVEPGARAVSGSIVLTRAQKAAGESQ